MSATFICECCGETRPIEERTMVEGEHICRDCVTHHAVVCDHCGELVFTEHSERDVPDVGSIVPGVNQTLLQIPT